MFQKHSGFRPIKLIIPLLIMTLLVIHTVLRFIRPALRYGLLRSFEQKWSFEVSFVT
jgi:hypothetical protein